MHLNSSRFTSKPSAPMADAVSLYRGKVMHMRMKPVVHRFTYKVFSMLIDLDRLDDANRQAATFSVNRANLSSFHESDHGPRDGSSLRLHINQMLADGGLNEPAHILLWCNPRILGYTFNPLSIYYCLNDDLELETIVYQVHNTFGQSHCYVAANDGDDEGAETIRQSADKKFYVSPFLDMGLRYDFRLSKPNEALKVRILEHDDDGPILAATFSGRKQTLNNRNLLLGIFKCLGLTWKIMAGIHYEAFWLWVKGIGLRPRPQPPAGVSHAGSRQKIVAGE